MREDDFIEAVREDSDLTARAASGITFKQFYDLCRDKHGRLLDGIHPNDMHGPWFLAKSLYDALNASR